MSFKKVTHVIFDLDGLIIDSETLYKKAIGDIAAKYGKQYTKDVQLKILGTTEPNTARIAIKEMNLPISPAEFLDMYHTNTRKLLQHPTLMPGAKDLIEHLSKHNVPIAVATSSAQDMLDLKIQDHLEMMGLFHHIVCGSSDPEVKNGKPAPDIFLVCASRFDDNPKPEQCLVFEDAPNGAVGAVAAGMQVVLVPDPQVPENLRTSATLVLDSLKDFQPEVFGLPTWSS